MNGFAWGGRMGNRVVLLKSPAYPVLFSERHRRGVCVISLAFGWRVTIRIISPLGKEPGS